MTTLIYLYRLLTCAVPTLIYVIYKKRKAGPDFSGRRVAALFLFAVYMAAIFQITDCGTLYDIIHSDFTFQVERINTLLFAGPGTSLTLSLLNVLLFIPFGLSISLLWPRRRGLFLNASLGLGFSLLIELSQLLNHRSSDIDDIILNALGAVIGYALFSLILRRFVRTESKRLSKCFKEAAALILLIFAFHFFAFNEYLILYS